MTEEGGVWIDFVPYCNTNILRMLYKLLTPPLRLRLSDSVARVRCEFEREFAGRSLARARARKLANVLAEESSERVASSQLRSIFKSQQQIELGWAGTKRIRMMMRMMMNGGAERRRRQSGCMFVASSAFRRGGVSSNSCSSNSRAD